MPDTRPHKKKPKWLTGEDGGAPERGRSPSGSRRGPLADDDTSEIPATDNPAAGNAAAGNAAAEEEASERLVDSPRSDAAATATIPRFTPTQAAGASGGIPGGVGAGGPAQSGGSSPAELVQRLRSNPGPALMALLVLIVLFVVVWFVFLRGGGEAAQSPANEGSGGGEAPLAAQPSPEAGGVDETGIVFSGLDERGDTATLQGAGLEWEGSITEKEGDAGETITLKGPTAAQVERGFEVDNTDVDSGVYAVGQDDGSVLHVATHTYQLVTEQQDAEADEQIVREITYGTIFDLEGGDLRQSGFYVDRHPEQGSAKTLRTYYKAPDFDPKDSYEVAFNARKGTPVPLLVGYRDKEQAQQNNGGEE
ncbi:MAG: hypothetical protein ACFB50_13885 [Rubrobacteraceae bacterium]